MSRQNHFVHSFPFPGVLRPLALLMASSLSGIAAAQTHLGEVEISAVRDQATLGLDRASNTASRTGIPIRALPASVSSLDASQLEERGDFQMRQAVTRATGITDIGSGGTGGLS